MTIRLMFGLSAALGLASCGGSGGGESGAGSTETGDTETGEAAKEVPFEAFYEAAEVAFCGWQVACGGYGVEARCRDVNHIEAQLVMARLAGVGSEERLPIDYVRAALEAGTMVYDGEKAAVCLEFVGARSCDIVQVWTEEALAGQAACAEVFTGRIGRNGPCLTGSECAEPSACGFDPACTATEMCCVGACRAFALPLAVGEACTGQVACEADTFCDFGATPSVCAAAPKLGQACPSGACAGENFCRYNNNDGSTVCSAPQAEGGECYGDEECAGALICVYDGDFTSRCYRPRAEGEGCDPDRGGQGCLRVDQGCDPGTRKCAPLPGKGEPCLGYQCQGDLFCSSAAGERCVPVADAGEGCGYRPNNDDAVPCSGDHVCDYDEGDGVCAAPSGRSSCPIPGDPGAG